MRMYEYLIYILVGALAGFVRALVTGKGLIALPKIERVDDRLYLNAGFITAMIIGAFTGAVAPYTLGVNTVVAALAGYVGEDFIENLIERVLGYPKKAEG